MSRTGDSERAALPDRDPQRVAGATTDGPRRPPHGPGLYARRHRGPNTISVSTKRLRDFQTLVQACNSVTDAGVVRGTSNLSFANSTCT